MQTVINEGPHGCLIWFGDLIDIRLLINEDSAQLELYVRLAASEIGMHCFCLNMSCFKLYVLYK
jgi:hypothetical protein